MFQLQPDKQSHGLSVGTWYTKNHSAIFFFCKFRRFWLHKEPRHCFFVLAQTRRPYLSTRRCALDFSEAPQPRSSITVMMRVNAPPPPTFRARHLRSKKNVSAEKAIRAIRVTRDRSGQGLSENMSFGTYWCLLCDGVIELEK